MARAYIGATDWSDIFWSLHIDGGAVRHRRVGSPRRGYGILADGFILKNAVIRRGRCFSFFGSFPSVRWRLEFLALEYMDARREGRPRPDQRSAGLLWDELSGHRLSDRGRPCERHAGRSIARRKSVLDDIETKGWHFDRLNGQLHWQGDEVRLSHAELHEGAALVSGEILYRPNEHKRNSTLPALGLRSKRSKVYRPPHCPLAGSLISASMAAGPFGRLWRKAICM